MLILTYITPGYVHWFHHLYLNLQLLSLDSYFHVCTSSYMELPIQNVTILNSQFSKKAQTFGSKEYGKIVNHKHHCILKLYKLTDILFIDTDVTLFRSPFPYLKSNVPLFLEDSGPFRKKGTLNSGCIYLPQTIHSIEFMNTFMLNLKREKKSRNDQDVLNKYKPNEYRLLPQYLFTNGFRFYENRHKQRISKRLVLVHHNWISGDVQKWNRAKSFDCVLNESSKVWFSTMLERSLEKKQWVYRYSV